MATPIKETPVLHGKDAKRFIKLTNDPKKVSKEEQDRILKNYEIMKKISKG